MSRIGPRDPALYDQWRRARRVAILALHPDRGGAPGALADRLAQLDADFTARDGRLVDRGSVALAAPPPWQPLTRMMRRSGRGVRSRIRSVRRRIPPRWPGSRRYLDL